MPLTSSTLAGTERVGAFEHVVVVFEHGVDAGLFEEWAPEALDVGGVWFHPAP